MGASKSYHFNEAQNQVANIAKALGHPARIAIVAHLLKVNSCICNDLVNELPLSQPTISQHIKELKLAGIIKGNIEGNSICYCLNEEAFETLSHFFGLVKTHFIDSKKCC